MVVLIVTLSSLLVFTNLIWLVNYKRLGEEWLKTFLAKESELSAMRIDLMKVEIESRGFALKGADDDEV